MPRGRTPIGLGEFQAPGGSPLAQYSFLQEIRRQKQTVLHELAAIADGPPGPAGVIGRVYPTYDVSEIVAWGKRHGLSDPWVQETAAATVNQWRQAPDVPRHDWTLFGVGGSEPDWPALDAFTWNPLRTTRAQAMKAMNGTKTARAMRADYLDSVEALAIALGFVRCPFMRRPSHAGALTALVRYQVCRKKIVELAGGIAKDNDQYETERRMIYKTLKRMAGVVGLTLRRSY